MGILELTYSSKNEDKRKFCDAYLEIWNDLENICYLSFSGNKFNNEQITNWVNSLNENGNIRYFYFHDNDDINGIVVVNSSKIEGYEILGLGVKAANKKKGIGSELINYCISDAKQNDYRSIQAIVFSDTKNMLRLVIKNDFLPVCMEYGQRYDGMSTIKLQKKMK